MPDSRPYVVRRNTGCYVIQTVSKIGVTNGQRTGRPALELGGFTTQKIVKLKDINNLLEAFWPGLETLNRTHEEEARGYKRKTVMGTWSVYQHILGIANSISFPHLAIS